MKQNQDESKFLSIYSSSAGSGKTYTLAREYLKLVLGDDATREGFNRYYYRHILAVTFTNDAAHEMKERILSNLQGFANLEQLPHKEQVKLRILLNDVTEGINKAQSKQLTESMVQYRAKEVFKSIIHDYSSFSVSTIDSFTQRVVSAFTEELGIPYNFDVSLDAETLLEAAVHQLLAKIGADGYASLTKIMMDFTEDLADNGGNWNRLHIDIASFAKILLEDKHHERIVQLQSLEPQDFLQLNRKIADFMRRMDESVKQLGTRGFELITEQNLEATDFFQGNRGIYGYFKKWAETPDFVENGANSYVKKTVEENKWGGSKTPAPILAMIEGIKMPLAEAVEQIESIREDNLPRYKVYKLLRKRLPKLALLKQLSIELQDIEDSTNTVHISAFNRKIMDIVLNEPVPFIYERLGEKYYHILIDEFQDTSVLQWTNFMPLIDNSLAYQRFNLLVGDAKQSIYRFRGGEMEQIVYLHRGETTPLIPDNDYAALLVERYFNIERNVIPEVLDTNYRSAHEIIAFNNDLFQFVVESHQTEFELLAKAYNDFKQNTHAGTSFGGHVEIDFLPITETDTEDEVTLRKIWDLIQQLIINEGFEPKDIAVLCRKNKQSGKVANFLKGKHIEYPDGRIERLEIISQDSLSLNFSEAVNLVTSVMWVIQSPAHQLAKYEALYLFYKIVLQQIPDTKINQTIKEVVESPDPKAFFEHLKTNGYSLNAFKLQQASLYELAEELVTAFRLFDRSHETAYLFRFLDVVLDFSLRQINQLTDFLDFWDTKKTKLSIITESDQNAVTITSVHKSKGLEYPVVIVPYANWQTKPNARDQIWADLVETDFPELNLEANEHQTQRRLSVGTFNLSASALEKTPIEPIYEQERQMIFLDNLNTLYVALTRPTNRLYLLTPSKDPSKMKDSIGAIFYNYLVNKGLYETEKFDYIISAGAANTHQSVSYKENNVLEINNIISFDRTDKVRLSHSAERVFDLETFDAKKDYGNKVHTAFSKIKSKNDINTALQEMIFKGEITPSESKELKIKIESIIKHPDLEPLFAENIQTENEREILLQHNSYRPDRVVFLQDQVVILDYKTGSPKDAHQTQIKRYSKLYEQMGFENVTAYLVYLELEQVVRV